MDSKTPPASAPPRASPDAAVSGTAPVPWWLWPNLLSLDAPLVAVAWLWLMATTLSIQIPEPWWCYGILAAAVWAIYVIDRLLDGMSVGDPQSITARHRFYRSRRSLFAILAVAAGGVAVWGALFHAPSDLLRYGVMAGFVTAFYLMQSAGARLRNATINRISVLSAAAIIGIFVLQIPNLPNWLGILFLAATATMGIRLALEPGGSFFHALPKEIFCGLTFAVGVSLPVLVWTELALADMALLGGLFSLNCIAIALYEQGHDELNDPVAITKHWPRIRDFYPFLVTSLAVLAAALAFLHRDDQTHLFSAAVALGAVLLGALHALSRHFGSGALRVLADAAVLVPPAAVSLLRTFSA